MQSCAVAPFASCNTVQAGRQPARRLCPGCFATSFLSSPAAQLRSQCARASRSEHNCSSTVNGKTTTSTRLRAVSGLVEGVPSRQTDAAEVTTGYWTWRGHRIRYQQAGTQGPPVLMVHGFGGNCDHWRKNLPVVGAACRAYAVDLLGYGYSDKPDPRQQPPNSIYNFETWAEQLLDFIKEKIGEPAFLTSNSVGGISSLQAAKVGPDLVLGVQVMNVSLRMLHASKQSPAARPFVNALQWALRETQLGGAFFSQVAQPKKACILERVGLTGLQADVRAIPTPGVHSAAALAWVMTRMRQAVRNVLRQCYHDPETVTDALVEAILRPGLQPGAVHVFLDFISYSSGPLAEDLLDEVQCPVSVLWGERDPWEKLEWGLKFKEYSSVEEFVVLPNVGHCPMDEAPQLVNPAILKFVQRHSQP